MKIYDFHSKSVILIVGVYIQTPRFDVATRFRPTMMTTELIEAIVSGVEGEESLRACSLVSPSFRGASQRILFRTLTLYAGANPNYSRACTLITESPHIIAYILNLDINLPMGGTSLAQVTSLRWVLTQLAHGTHLQRCSLGLGYSNLRWSELGAEISSAVVDLISKQRLRSLRIECWDEVPPSVLLRLIASASTLYFDDMDLDVEDAAFSSIVSPASSILERLIIRRHAKAMSEILARPPFAGHITNLRILSLELNRDFGAPMALISSAAASLEQINIKFRAFRHS